MPPTGLAQLAALVAGRGAVPWIRHRAVRLSACQLETLAELGEVVASGGIPEAEFEECVAGAVAAALEEAERRQLATLRTLRPAPPARPPAEEMLLVTVLTGGSGVCPVCRAPVTNILRLGPDTRTTDGRMVALVLPTDAYPWKPQQLA